ncbi:MAG: ammonium transporter family protein [Solirubrobacteraceae bacterium]
MSSLLGSLSPVASVFANQVTGNSYVEDIFYALATVCLLFVVAAVGLIDAGLVRRKSLLDTWVQKIICALIAGFGMAVVGYAIWQAQYYQAFGIPTPIGQAISDWWLFGPAVTHFSQNLDPKLFPTADVFQIFLVFFVAYAMVGGALLHSAGLERVKAVPMYVICAVAGAIVIPIALYYTWGSTSPLTNRGVHDYIGTYSLYVVVGVWALLIAWRAGPRLGAFKSDPRTIGPVPHNLSWSAIGIGILMFAAPFAFLGCGYIVPGSGYYGISLTTSGFGIALINIFMAYIGGGLGGALISYRTKNPIMALIGVAAGYIGAGASLDIGKPWQILIVSFIAAFVVYGVYLLLYRLKIDDKKIVPLALGGGVYSAIAAGIVGAGDKTGGYFGLTGKYAPQHASISLGWQLIGLLVTVGIALVSGLAVILGLEKTIGLRVTEDQEVAGLDDTYWKAPPSPYEDTPIGAGTLAAERPMAQEGVGALPHPA